MKSKFLKSALGLLVIVLLPPQGTGADPAQQAPDAITAASMTLSMGTITATTAVVKYSNDRERTGTRTLCYDPAPASPTHNCIAHPAGGVNSGSFTLTNLTAKTLYNYKITASDGRHSPYSATGTFTTAQAVGIIHVQVDMGGPIPRKGPVFDVQGRKRAPEKRSGIGVQRPAP